MSMTIAAVPAAGPPDVPAPVQPRELPVSDFVAALQNAPMSGMPQLANPAALTSEIFNHLRGFVERAHYYENLKLTPVRPTDDGNVSLTSFDGDQLTNLPGGGPARDNPALADLARASEGGSATSRPVDRSTIADLQRVAEFCLSAMNFSTEATMIGGGTAQLVQSVDTLLRGQ